MNAYKHCTGVDTFCGAPESIGSPMEAPFRGPKSFQTNPCWRISLFEVEKPKGNQKEAKREADVPNPWSQFALGLASGTVVFQVAELEFWRQNQLVRTRKAEDLFDAWRVGRGGAASAWASVALAVWIWLGF